MPTPRSVARATFLCGSRTTSVATAALSTPVKAQNIRVSAPGTAWPTGVADGFQFRANKSGLNQNQPSVAMAITGANPSSVVADSRVATRPGPAMFASTTSQITTMTPVAAPVGLVSPGMNAEA